MLQIILSLAAAVCALMVAIALYRTVLAAPTASERANEIAAAIRAGAEAFLNRQYRTVAMVGAPILLLIGFALNWWYAFGFLLGAVASAAAGIIGMTVSVRANVRVAEAAHSGFGRAFDLAFKGGAVTGLMVVGAGLLALAIIVLCMHLLGYYRPDALLGLAFGGSLISVFARLGGGIFTKGADVGADLVGKVEANIPEDDPRNPAVIADNVGDNVGDCAGMAADLFETYGVTAAAAMLLAHIIFPESDSMFLYPMLVGVAGIVGSLVAVPFVSIDEPLQGQQPAVMNAMYRGLAVAGVVMLVVTGFFNFFVDFPDQDVTGQVIGGARLLGCALMGAILTAVMMWVTDLYTGDGSRFVSRIARASQGGHATTASRRWRCSRSPASSCPSTPTGRSRTTPAGSRRWPSSAMRCAPSPIRWTPLATRRRPSPRATPSRRRASPQWCSSPPTSRISGGSRGSRWSSTCPTPPCWPASSSARWCRSSSRRSP
jgi:K(+)-stimulated pyrophosphate-energized sodium pump